MYIFIYLQEDNEEPIKAEATLSQKSKINSEIRCSGCKLCLVIFLILLIRDL